MAKRNDEHWLEQFDAFKGYVTENASFPNATNIVYNGAKVGQWYRNQLTAYKGGFLPPMRLALLDTFNPVWRGTLEERQAESNRMLLASTAWKDNLSEKDVSIDTVFSSDTLASAISHGIYSCQAYLEACEQYLNAKGLSYFNEVRGLSSQKDNLFSLDNREAVFEAQFPNLSFRHFYLYLAIFAGNPPDLFKPEEIEALGHQPNFYEMASAMSAYSQYASRTDMVKAYEDVLNTLTPHEKAIVSAKYIDGMPRMAIAESVDFTPDRVRRVLINAFRKLRHPSRSKKLCPEHPQDAQARREEEARTLERKQLYEQFLNSGQNALLATPIESLDLSVRSYNCLRRSGLETLGDITSLSPDELMGIRNLGSKCVTEIVQVLHNHNLALRSSHEAPARATEVNSSTARETNLAHDTDIESLNLSVRSFMCLKRANINTLGELASLSAQDLMAIPYMGRKPFEEIVCKLEEYGVFLTPAPARDEEAVGGRIPRPSLDNQIASANARTTPPGGGGPDGMNGPGGR